MDWKTVIFHTIGGLGLFLMGMKVMSESMQKAAGEKLRKILRILTKNRFVALFVGIVVTGIIQSSGATAVMTKGFINAGLMTIQQSLSIELGACIGTTVTGWIVTLDMAMLSLPIVGIGVLMRLFSRNRTWQYVGEIIYGFGILFLGMSTMKQGFGPLKTNPTFLALFKSIDGTTYSSIFLGVFVGIVATIIAQSSSAIVGILIALASQGLINFDGALAVVLGSNIGATSTGALASVGGVLDSKRDALGQVTFQTFGVAIMLIFFRPFRDFVNFIAPGTPESSIMAHVAMGHTVYNVINAIIVMPLLPLLTRFVTKVLPEGKVVEKVDVPDTFIANKAGLFDTPALGILESENLLQKMSDYVIESLHMLRDMSLNNPQEVDEICDKIVKNEDIIDKYQYNITQLLLKISSKSLSPSDATKVASYIGLAHNFEKVGDCVDHIGAIIGKLKKNNMSFSDIARSDINRILEENIAHFEKSIEIFKSDELYTAYADEALHIRIKIKDEIKDAKDSHFQRINDRICDGSTAIPFSDVLNNLNVMSSENRNIAEVLSGKKY